MSAQECIKKARMQLGMSQRALGKVLGFHHSIISQWEIGRHKPQIHNIKRIVDKLKELNVEYKYEDFQD